MSAAKAAVSHWILPHSDCRAAKSGTARQGETRSQQVEEMMVNLYNTCYLVHADLSEYNILWFNGECWFIDVSS